jgi:hypothetical protein
VDCGAVWLASAGTRATEHDNQLRRWLRSPVKRAERPARGVHEIGELLETQPLIGVGRDWAQRNVPANVTARRSPKWWQTSLLWRLNAILGLVASSATTSRPRKSIVFLLMLYEEGDLRYQHHRGVTSPKRTG